jgi:hypothetical protein
MKKLEGALLLALALSPALVQAKDAVPNLGGGLDKLVAAPPAARALARQALASGGLAASSETASSETEAALGSPMEFDDAGRVHVRVTFNGQVPRATALESLGSINGVEIAATDVSRADGPVESYVPVEALARVAKTRGVLAVVPSVPMVMNVGATTTQGIVQHRIDKVSGFSGGGITIGVISDSYDTNVAPNSAALDISTGDLPGTGNPLGNTEPVVVLEDAPARTDEGRAMLQIVHDIVPKARLGFATSAGGQVNLANNIRALAGFASAPNARPDFKADIIVDDVIYPDEPFFQDGIVAQAVDEVVATGIAYFSSAGNRPSTQAYDSKPRIVPGQSASWQGTNLNFANVPPALYAGGFHNFAGTGVLDIAQTVQFTAGSQFVFQWNEPFDPKPPVLVGTPFASGVGTVPNGGSANFTFSGTAGQTVQIFVDADTTTTGTPIPDTVLQLFSPTNALLQTIDTGTNPESITLALPANGTYRVNVSSFVPTQGGDFLYRVQNVQVPEQVLTDYNILFFRTDGSFLGALAEQNTFTNRPMEIATLNVNIPLQVVIARANTPDASRAADRIRYVGFGGVLPQEYFSYTDPVTYGHNSAAGAIGVAAYAFYAPFVPEAFTSPGPSTIYFDKNDKRLRHPEVRQKPDLAAMDGANTTFFIDDSLVDDDTFPNFFGTSAAAPHAAAIGALVLEAAGGPGSVQPARMRRILQDSAFVHDLDPYFSSGFAVSWGNILAINAAADASGVSQFDPNVFTVTQFGARSLTNLSINGTGGDPTQTPSGIVFDERATPLPAPGQPFIVGRTFGVNALDATATFSMPADAPGLAGQWRELDITFLPGTFRSGDLLSFGVDRDEADVAGPGGAAGGNSADLLGGGVLIPSGRIVPGGASFFGKFQGGFPFRGEFFNLLGHGYSSLDGYGFINAEAAVKAARRRH